MTLASLPQSSFCPSVCQHFKTSLKPLGQLNSHFIGLFVDEDHSKLHTLNWLSKLNKWPYKSRFIANSSACTATELSILLTSCLTVIKKMSLNIAQQFKKVMVKMYFWSINSAGEILNKLKSRGFLAFGLSTYDFTTLYFIAS